MNFVLRFALITIFFFVASSHAKEAVRSTRARTPAKATIDPNVRQPNVNEAQDREDLKNLTGFYMDEGLRATRDMQPACFDCDPATEGSRVPSPQCRDTYADMYARDTVDFRYVFGYIDNFNAEDGPAREAAIEGLTRPCGSYLVGACGFRQESEDDGEVYVKKMKGPDGKEKTVRLTIVSSSASTNLQKNRNELAASQRRQSARAKQVFEDGLRNSDMTIYVGHGRDGGGPSFEPPVLRQNRLPGAPRPGVTADGREAVNYDYYQRNRQSRTSMLNALATGTRPPKLFGMFACHTEKYFSAAAVKASERGGVARTGFVGSQGYTALEAMYTQSMMMLDSVLALRCQGDFERAVHAVKSVTVHPSQPPVNQLPPITRKVWDRAVPRATMPPVRPAPIVAAPPPEPVPSAEPIPTGETVRPDRPPVFLPDPGLGQQVRPAGSSDGSSPTQIERADQ